MFEFEWDEHPLTKARRERRPTIPVKQWKPPDWWREEYEEIPGARLYTEAELKKKLARKRYYQAQKLKRKPKPEPTPEEIRAKQMRSVEALVKEAQTKLSNARVRLPMHQAELTAPDVLPYVQQVIIPHRISKAQADIAYQQGVLERRLARLAALKESPQ